MNQTLRRRALLRAFSWPVTVESTMLLNRIVLDGSISVKNDWRSSGYIPVPPGATGIKVENLGEAKDRGRIGLPLHSEQISGIPMLADGAVFLFGLDYDLPADTAFVYISRSGSSEVPIRITFYKTLEE